MKTLLALLCAVGVALLPEVTGELTGSDRLVNRKRKLAPLSTWLSWTTFRFSPFLTLPRKISSCF